MTKDAHLELLENNRGGWSWIYWGENGKPLALSAGTYPNVLEAAQALKKIRKEIRDAPTIFYQNRRDTGRPVTRRFSDLNTQSHKR